MKQIGFLTAGILSLVLVTGCEQQSDDRLKEKTQIEGAIQAQEQLKIEQARVADTEEAINKKQDFLEANGGHFEGTVTRNGDTHVMRISLFPNFPRYKDKRVRTLSVVSEENAALAYNVQIMLWNADKSIFQEGCRFVGIRPQANGQIELTSPECSGGYYLLLQGNTINGTAQLSDVYDVYLTKVSGTTTQQRKPQ